MRMVAVRGSDIPRKCHLHDRQREGLEASLTRSSRRWLTAVAFLSQMLFDLASIALHSFLVALDLIAGEDPDVRVRDFIADDLGEDPFGIESFALRERDLLCYLEICTNRFDIP